MTTLRSGRFCLLLAFLPLACGPSLGDSSGSPSSGGKAGASGSAGGAGSGASIGSGGAGSGGGSGAASCGTACRTGELCVAGSCECQSGLTDCSGTCTDTQADPAHCGASCAPCAAGQVCSLGLCKVECDAGLVPCGSACVNVDASVQHCGACDAPCGAGQICDGGECTCPGAQTFCNGVCVDTSSDPANCGSCGSVCNGICSAGSCNSGSGGASGSGGTGNGGTGGSGGGTGGSNTGGGGGSSGGASGTGGGGGSSGGTGRSINGTCYPICASAGNDPDGDGWGWENEASCVVTGSAPYQQGTPCGGGGGSGGTSGSGGSGGTGGSAGSGGSGGSAGCSVQPVTPNATQQARNLLCYLYSIYGNHVLSGQQETSWSSPANDISWYVTNTGKYPAVLGGDYLYPNGTTSRAIAYWNAGGIPMIRYHMGAPPASDTYENSQGTAQGGINAVLSPGTASYNAFIQRLDYAAAELQKLQDANVPVLWAPFHEAGGTWFWWSKETGAQYVRLWNFMFDYFVNTKGLRNLLWLHPYNGEPQSAFYPGRATVDIGGADTYATNPPFSTMFSRTRQIVGDTIPIALHETGRIPDPATMFAGNAAPWVLFSVWAGYQISNNSLSDVQRAYDSPYTITRDEVPNLK